MGQPTCGALSAGQHSYAVQGATFQPTEARSQDITGRSREATQIISPYLNIMPAARVKSKKRVVARTRRLTKRAAALHSRIRRSLRVMRGGDRMGAWQGFFPEAAPLHPDPSAPGWANAPTICSNPTMARMLGGGTMDETFFGRAPIGRTDGMVSPFPAVTNWAGAGGKRSSKKKRSQRRSRRKSSRRAISRRR